MERAHVWGRLRVRALEERLGPRGKGGCVPVAGADEAGEAGNGVEGVAGDRHCVHARVYHAGPMVSVPAPVRHRPASDVLIHAK